MMSTLRPFASMLTRRIGSSSARARRGRDHLAGEVGVADVGRGEVLRHHGFDHRCEHADGDVARTRFSVRAGRGGRRSPGRRSTWRPPAGCGDGSCRRSSWRSSATTRSSPHCAGPGAACWRPARSRRGRPQTGLGGVARRRSGYRPDSTVAISSARRASARFVPARLFGARIVS